MERLPGWREEARAHLGALDALVRASAAAMPTVDTLLGPSGARALELPALARRTPQWARETGFAGARRGTFAGGAGHRPGAVAVARELARARRGGGDGSLPLALAAIDRGVVPRPGRAGALGRAHADYTDGLAMYNRNAYEDAARLLGRAERGLRAHGSAAARWAAHYRAVALVNRGEYDASERILRAIAAAATPAEPVLRGKTIWSLSASTRDGADRTRWRISATARRSRTSSAPARARTSPCSRRCSPRAWSSSGSRPRGVSRRCARCARSPPTRGPRSSPATSA